MNNIFCQKCGKGNQYATASQPNFCQYCGTPFGNAVASAEPERPARRESQTVRASRRREASVESYDDRSEDEIIADIQDLGAKARVEIVLKDVPKTPGEQMNVGQILASAGTVRNTGISDDRPDTGKSYRGGDKQQYLQKVFGGNMKKTVIDAAGER